MCCKHAFLTISGALFKKTGWLPFILMVYFSVAPHALLADNVDQRLRISYDNNILTLSARNADLKQVLFKLSEKTDIIVRFPASLKKKITLNKSGVSLKDALRSLLKGLNHAIIYTRSDDYQAVVSKVFIFDKSKKTTAQVRLENRLTRRIKSYERRIESLRKNLARTGRNSPRGKRYLRQIERLEKNIEKLERRLN
jgi:predicted RNase H-like nuclease (RuvC/YqgF family)